MSVNECGTLDGSSVAINDKSVKLDGPNRCWIDGEYYKITGLSCTLPKTPNRKTRRASKAETRKQRKVMHHD